MSNYSGPPLPSFKEEKKTNAIVRWGNYFKAGIMSVTPSANKSVSGRILPGFDWKIKQIDSEFKKGWAPYRIADMLDEDTNEPRLSAFYFKLYCYTFFGKNRANWLSPMTRKSIGGNYTNDQLADPIDDIRKFIFKEGSRWKHLVSKGDGEKLPFPAAKGVFNMWGSDPRNGELRNLAVDVSMSAIDDLQNKLNVPRKSSQPVLDEDWPDYLYGDITNPNTGLVVKSANIAPVGKKAFNGFIFKPGAHNTLEGIEQRAVPIKAMEGRHNFWSEEVINIEPYQSIVDFLLSDGTLDRELVAFACSDRADIPIARTVKPEPAHVIVPAPVLVVNEEETEDDDAPPPPVEKPEEGEELLWVSYNSNVTRMSRADIQLYYSGGKSFKVMSADKKSGWVEPSFLGFVAPEETTAPPVAAEKKSVKQVKSIKDSILDKPLEGDALMQAKARFNELEERLNKLEGKELMEYVSLGAKLQQIEE